MQPIVAPPPTGKVAFQQGLIFGLAQAVVASSVLLINAFVSAGAGVGLLLDILSFLTGLAAYFLAGMMGAKQNGRLRTGVFAGMWTGAIYGIIDFVLSAVIFFQVSLPRAMDLLNNSSTTSTMSPDTIRTVAIATGIGSEIFGLLFAIGLGAGLGALGGLIGRNISKFKAVPVMPAYPVYPGQQPYPGQPAPYQPYAAPAQPGAYPAPEQSVSNTPPAEQIYPEQ